MQVDHTKTVYLMGIGGIAMGTLATMLIQKGYRVLGSDQNLYPPMSDHLARLGIPVYKGYDARNVLDAQPDMVVIGNVIRRDNPEALCVMDRQIPHLSMPQAIARFFLCDHKSMVVTGTHGKSTTSALLAWMLFQGGLDPSAFIGAFLKDWGESHRLGRGPFMVIEGDEYDTAFFDKGPKFLHYQPHIGVLTSIEYDHADIFKDLNAIRSAFRSFVQLIPEDGVLILNVDDPECLPMREVCRGRVMGYGSSPEAAWRLLDLEQNQGGVHLRFVDSLSGTEHHLTSPLLGKHNAFNALAVIAACRLAGMSLDSIQQGILRFNGVKRRQDRIGEVNGILVMDDFAHHPTAVKETIEAVKLFYPSRRLIAAFEPRTNSSRRNVFQDAYAAAFDDADVICLKCPPGIETIPEAERLDPDRLVRDIGSRRKHAELFANTDALVDFLVEEGHPGDIILCMSNGSFDGLPRRLIGALESSRVGQDDQPFARV
jgi:UDP-N-acetylmuramate: L-alanyl-gamma-D-glutamyl-meso-diaminopimelate ligase